MVGCPGAKAVVGVEVHRVVPLLPFHFLKCHSRLVGGKYRGMEGQAPVNAQPDKTNSQVEIRCCLIISGWAGSEYNVISCLVCQSTWNDWNFAILHQHTLFQGQVCIRHKLQVPAQHGWKQPLDCKVPPKSTPKFLCYAVTMVVHFYIEPVWLRADWRLQQPDFKLSPHSAPTWLHCHGHAQFITTSIAQPFQKSCNESTSSLLFWDTDDFQNFCWSKQALLVQHLRLLPLYLL